MVNGGDEHPIEVDAVGLTSRAGGTPQDEKKKKLTPTKILTNASLKKEKRSCMAKLPPY